MNGPIRMREDQGGVSIVEFALLTPFFFFLLFGMIQYGFVIAAQITLRQAAATAARHAILSLPSPNENEIKQVAKTAGEPLLKQANLREPVIDRNATVGGVGGATRVQLVYDLPPLIPGIVPGPGANGGFVIRAESVMR